MVEYHLPLRLVSEMNSRDHWVKRNRRRKVHHKAALLVQRHPLPCVVTITRVGKKRMDDDNLASSAKFLRDGIATRLGVDDADPRVTWRYEQLRGEYGVIVNISEQERGKPNVNR